VDAIANCSYCQQPLGSEVATVHAANAHLHYLCAMIHEREMAARAPRPAIVAA
jgi:hypothetical protein